METLLIVVVVILSFLCAVQFYLFTQLSKLFMEVHPSSITDNINSCFDKLYDRQSKILVKKFWQKSVDGLIYINKDFFENITYDIAPSQIKVIFSSYLSGMYDKEVEEALACYTYCLLNICSKQDKVIYRNVVDKYEKDLKLRWGNVSKFTTPKYFITGTRCRNIVNIFDTHDTVEPNQYVYGYFYDYDCCFKEDYERLVSYVSNFVKEESNDIGSTLYKLGHLLKFINYSRFKTDDFFAHNLASELLKGFGFSECVRWDGKSIIFSPFAFNDKHYDFQHYEENDIDFYTCMKECYSFAKYKLSSRHIHYALYTGALQQKDILYEEEDDLLEEYFK